MTVMNMRSVTVHLSTGPLTLQIFRDPQRFLAHVRDHFVCPHEPWDRVIPRKLLKHVCQKINAPPVRLVEALYERVANAIADGAAFSAALPLYAIINERVCAKGGREWEQTTTYFIAEKGFMIICGDHTVKSAYFCAETPSDAAYTLFQRAWKTVKSRCAMKQYVDEKYATVHTRVAVHMESEKNWQCCPNPHQRPRSAFKKRSPPDESEHPPRIFTWEDDYASEI